MALISEIFKFDLANLSHMTELLEACNWDDKELESQLKSISEGLDLIFDNASLNSDTNFNQWLDLNLKDELTILGINDTIINVVKKIILNHRDEIISFMDIQEN